MTSKSTLGVSLIALSLMSASAALAGGPATPAVEPVPTVAPIVVKPKPTLTFTVEETPEFYATSKAGSYSKDSLADEVTKLSLAKALSNGWSVGGSLAFTVRAPGTNGSYSGYNQLELGGGYKYKLNDIWSLTPSAYLGYAFGNQPKISLTDPSAAEAYYSINLAADMKIDSAWTWNVFNIRYRNAFSVTWITPKITTGFTYKVGDTDNVYANIGESWKDTGSGSKADKYSVAFGFKHSF